MDEKTERVFFEIHKNLPRQGPGSYASTKRAFDCIRNLPRNPKILDIGCGPGKQTLDLLSLTNGSITGLDYYQVFLHGLEEKAAQRGLKERIHTLRGDMSNLPFAPASFDLIWSEGAIYIMGFANGLAKWKKFVKPGGYVAVSEVTWLKKNPPQELAKYWEGEYVMRDIKTNLRMIRETGYKILGHFALPSQDWWEDYYTIIQKRLSFFRQKYKNDDIALQVVDAEEKEMSMHLKYADYYGYVFYIMQRE